MISRTFFLVAAAILAFFSSPMYAQWPKTIIDTGYNVGVWVDPQDLAGDPRPDLLVTDYLGNRILLYINQYPAWEAFLIDGTRSGPTFARCADVDGDDTLDFIASFPLQQLVGWYENNHPTWTWHLISDSTDDGDFFSIADINDDGQPDVVTGPSYGDHTGDLVWLENQDPVWVEHVIESASYQYPTNQVLDVDQDGRLDIVAAVMNQNEVVWFRNEDTGINWTRHIIDDAVEAPFCLNTGDINGDDAMDLVLSCGSINSVYWYEQLEGSWVRHLIDGTLIGAGWPEVEDVDGDGTQDLVVAVRDGNRVVWYEQADAGWIQHSIDEDIDAPRGFPPLTDIDGDEVKDLLIPGQSELVWYKNPFTSVAYSGNLQVDPHYLSPVDGASLFSTQLVNPESHAVSVFSEIRALNSAFRDTLYLYDDGTHGDTLAGDDRYAGTQTAETCPEEYFTCTLHTRDLDAGLTVVSSHTENLTTAGPLSLVGHTYVDSLIHPGQSAQIYVQIQNESDTLTIPDVSVVLSLPESAPAHFMGSRSRVYGDIAPGATAVNSLYFWMAVHADCPDDTLLPVNVAISSRSTAYWFDSFSVPIQPSSASAPEASGTPLEFSIRQNYPNPFNSTTKIEYTLPVTATVRLELFSITGQCVAVLANGEQPHGRHTVVLQGDGLSSGIYLLRLSTPGGTFTRKIVLIQ